MSCFLDRNSCHTHAAVPTPDATIRRGGPPLSADAADVVVALFQAFSAAERAALQHPRVTLWDQIRHFCLEGMFCDSRDPQPVDLDLAGRIPSQRARELFLVADSADEPELALAAIAWMTALIDANDCEGLLLPATHLGALQRVSRADASAAFASLLSGLDHYRRRGVSGGTDPQAAPAALESAGRAWMTIAAAFRHDDVLRGALLRRVRGLVAPASAA